MRFASLVIANRIIKNSEQSVWRQDVYLGVASILYPS